MPYKVSYTAKSKRKRILSDEIYPSKKDARKYAKELNKYAPWRRARVVIHKYKR